MISAARFIGTWKLISLESQAESGEVVYPFGKDAHGQLIYTASGQMATQMMRTDRLHFTSSDPMKGAAEETQASFKDCGVYYGTYAVNLNEDFVDHHVEGALFPNWEGRAMRRSFAFAENSLTLTTPPARWGGGDSMVVVVPNGSVSVE